MTEVCGNAKCEGNEPSTCATDCTTQGGAVCGNSQCESTETNATCPGDCPTGGGTLDCADETVLFACFLCIAGGGCVGVTAADCQTCIGI